MRKSTSRIAATLAGILLSGCASSPWSPSPHSESKKPESAAPSKPPAPTPAAANDHSDTQAMQQVMAELQQIGAIDPAAREKLMADLKQTEPSLWPMVLQQFRAASAYRRQQEQRDAVSDSKSESPRTSQPASASQPQSASQSSAGSFSTVSQAPPIKQPAMAEPNASNGSSLPINQNSNPTSEQTDYDRRTTSPPRELPEHGGVPLMAAAGFGPSRANDRAATAPAAVKEKHDSAAAKGEVLAASYLSPIAPGSTNPADWQGQLTSAIQMLESQSKGSGAKGDGDVAMEARLRMLYLLAGRRDDAMKPISSAPGNAQDYWSKQIYGLSTWLDTEHTPDATRRAAETKRILSEAMEHLGESAPLAVHNPAFCTVVEGFGLNTPFKKPEFTPDQEVLLYAEIENFRIESTAKGYHTSLRGDYQIFDSRGQRVADRDYGLVEDTCQSPRKDFFVSYRLRLPKRINPGKYTLQLTIEDTKSHKVGQSTIDFVVKSEE